MEVKENIGPQKGKTPCTLRLLSPNYAWAFSTNYVANSVQK